MKFPAGTASDEDKRSSGSSDWVTKQSAHWAEQRECETGADVLTNGEGGNTQSLDNIAGALDDKLVAALCPFLGMYRTL